MIGWVSWVVLGYLLPWLAVLGRRDRLVLAVANGTWFIWVVASQSVAVISAALEPGSSTGRRELAFLAVFSWSVGIFLYAAQGIFVAARLFLYPVTPSDLTPPYWVAMGATAITVLAGARIVQMPNTPIVGATRELRIGGDWHASKTGYGRRFTDGPRSCTDGCCGVRGPISSGWCRSNAGRSERIRGMRTKLCRGGGHDVAHSSDAPQPHGSSTPTSGACRHVFQTLKKNGNMESPRMKAPMVDTVFSVVNPSLGR